MVAKSRLEIISGKSNIGFFSTCAFHSARGMVNNTLNRPFAAGGNVVQESKIM